MAKSVELKFTKSKRSHVVARAVMGRHAIERVNDFYKRAGSDLRWFVSDAKAMIGPNSGDRFNLGGLFELVVGHADRVTHTIFFRMNPLQQALAAWPDSEPLKLECTLEQWMEQIAPHVKFIRNGRDS
jgi:hypothetical protein